MSARLSRRMGPEPTQATSEFCRSTAAEPLGDGRYAVEVAPGWSGPPGPNGGFIAALILRAMTAEVGDPARGPRSITLHYLRPPAEQAAEVEVAIERSGRTASTVSARLVQEGRPMVIALAVYTESYEAPLSWQDPPPAARGAEEIEPLAQREAAPPIFYRLEMRPAFGPRPFSEGDTAEAGGWIRTREPSPLEPELLALYADAWWPAPFSRLDGPAAAPTLDLTIHFRSRPPEGAHEHVLGRFTTSACTEGVFEEDGALWAEDGTLLVQSRQLALLRPLG